MTDSKKGFKKLISIQPKLHTQPKKESNIIQNYSEKNIHQNTKNINNKNKNIELNSISITNNIIRLNKNHSHNYIDFHDQNNNNNKNELNNSTIATNYRNIVINNKNLFKNTFNKQKIKIPLSKSCVFSKTQKKLYDNNNISNKSINYLDSKTLEESKSKIENTNIYESYMNKNINNENENIINSNKSIKILLPKLNYKKKPLPFIIRSKNNKITANDIYLHYLKENENDKNKNERQPTIIDFAKYLKHIDNKKFNYGFNKIYGDDENFKNRINEIKKNKNIALKNDFNIQDYQKTLLKLLKKRVSEKSLEKLETRYKLFNERNYGMMIPRGRYINLADKLKDFLSKDIFEKVKRMDRNYVIYLEKKEELKHRNSLESANKNNFYRKLNNTIISFNRKRRQNKSV